MKSQKCRDIHSRGKQSHDGHLCRPSAFMMALHVYGLTQTQPLIHLLYAQNNIMILIKA